MDDTFFNKLLEAVFLYLIANSLITSKTLLLFGLMLCCTDVAYIGISKTLKDASIFDLLNPIYIIRRNHDTIKGTAPAVHLQWAVSNFSLMIVHGLMLAILWTHDHKFNPGKNLAPYWNSFVALIWIIAGIFDYVCNKEFYFGRHIVTRRRVYVATALSSTAELKEKNAADTIAAEMRKAQWYCYDLYTNKNVIPFAPNAFYPYFLDSAQDLDRNLGRACAFEFLIHCDALYLYTPGGSQSEADMTEPMNKALKIARTWGLEIKFFCEQEPQENFKPSPCQKRFPKKQARARFSHLNPEATYKKVFVCSPLRGKENTPKTITRNIRVAQWLCRKLIYETAATDKPLAVFAPQAFYPFFTNDAAATWLEFAKEIMTVCDAIYIYTSDGLDRDSDLTEGMKECKQRAESLGMEIVYRPIDIPDVSFNPSTWQAPF